MTLITKIDSKLTLSDDATDWQKEIIVSALRKEAEALLTYRSSISSDERWARESRKKMLLSATFLKDEANLICESRKSDE